MTANIRKGVLSFIIVEVFVYLIFMAGDIYGYPKADSVTLLKFSSILLCNIFTLVCAAANKKRDNYILAGALLFTGISDYFLLFTEYFTFGMLTFCVVQILYLVRLYFLEERRKRGGIPGRLLINAFLGAAALFVLYLLKVTVNPLLMISVFYFVSILHNVIRAIQNAGHGTDRRNLLFAAGMFLFMLCDINVGIYNMSGFIAVGNEVFQKLYHFSEIAMWMFYLPAQVCIVLSGRAEEKIQKRIF